MSHSPTLFSSDDECLTPCQEKDLQKKLQTLLQGVPPPSSITISKLTAEEILFKYKANEANFNFCNEVDDSFSSKRRNSLYFTKNNSNVCEDIASLSQKVQERYVQLETMSSCNIWFQSSIPLSGSAKKRSRAKQRIGLSPGRRLSHLARRKQIFSCANLQRMADMDKKRHIEIKKNGIYQDKGPDKSAHYGKLNTSKRALFLSPEDEANHSKHVKEFPKRKLFGSSEKKKKIPLKENSKRSEVRRWLFQQNFNGTEAASKKRLRDENYDQVPERKTKCPRRSLTFQDEEESSRSPGMSSTHSSISLPVLSQSHKNKLLWAVSVALKEASVTRKDPNFKKCASALFMTCRKNLNKILSSQVESTSEKMLEFARQNIPGLLNKLGARRSVLTPVKRNREEKLPESPKIPGKENLDQSAQSDSPVVFKTPIKFIRVKKKSKTCDNKVRLKGVLVRCKSLESLENLEKKSPEKKIVKKLFDCDMNSSAVDEESALEVTLLNDSDVNLASQTLAPSSVSEEAEGFSLLDALKKSEKSEMVEDDESVVDSEDSQEISNQEFVTEGPTRIEDSDQEEDLFEEVEKGEGNDESVTFSLIYEVGKGEDDGGRKIDVNLEELRREEIVEDIKSEEDEVIVSEPEDETMGMSEGIEEIGAKIKENDKEDEKCGNMTSLVEVEETVMKGTEEDSIFDEMKLIFGERELSENSLPLIETKEATEEMISFEEVKEEGTDLSENLMPLIETKEATEEMISFEEVKEEGTDLSENLMPLIETKEVTEDMMSFEEVKEEGTEDAILDQNEADCANLSNIPDDVGISANYEVVQDEGSNHMSVDGTENASHQKDVFEGNNEATSSSSFIAPELPAQEAACLSLAADPETAPEPFVAAEHPAYIAADSGTEPQLFVAPGPPAYIAADPGTVPEPFVAAEHPAYITADPVTVPEPFIAPEHPADIATDPEATPEPFVAPEPPAYITADPETAPELLEQNESVICDDSLLPSQTSTPILSPVLKSKSRKLTVKKSKKNWKIVEEESDDDVPLANLRNLKLKVRLSHEWEVVSKNYSTSDVENSAQQNNTEEQSTLDESEDTSECKLEHLLEVKTEWQSALTEESVNDVPESDEDAADSSLKQLLEEKNFVEIEPKPLIKEEEKTPEKDYAENIQFDVPEIKHEMTECNDQASQPYTSTVDHEALKEMMRCDEPTRREVKEESIYVTPGKRPASPVLDSSHKKRVLSLENYKARKQLQKDSIPDDLDGISPLKSDGSEGTPPKKIYNIRLKRPEDRHKHKRRKDKGDRHKRNPTPEVEEIRVEDEKSQHEVDCTKVETMFHTLTTISTVLERQIKCATEDSESVRKEDIVKNLGAIAALNEAICKELEEWMKNPENAEMAQKWYDILKTFYDNNPILKPKNSSESCKEDAVKEVQMDTVEHVEEIRPEERKVEEGKVDCTKVETMFSALTAMTTVLEKQMKCRTESPGSVRKEDIVRNLRAIEALYNAICYELEEWIKRRENAEIAKKWYDILKTFYDNTPILKPGKSLDDTVQNDAVEHVNVMEETRLEEISRHKVEEGKVDCTKVETMFSSLAATTTLLEEQMKCTTENPGSVPKADIVKNLGAIGALYNAICIELEEWTKRPGNAEITKKWYDILKTFYDDHPILKPNSQKETAQVQVEEMNLAHGSMAALLQPQIENRVVHNKDQTVRHREVGNVTHGYYVESVTPKPTHSANLVHTPPNEILPAQPMGRYVAPITEQTPPRQILQVQQHYRIAENASMEQTPPRKIAQVHPVLRTKYHSGEQTTPPTEILRSVQTPPRAHQSRYENAATLHPPQIVPTNSLYRPYESTPPKPQILVAPAPVVFVQYAQNVSYQNEQTPPKQMLHISQPPPLMSQPLKSPYANTLHKQAVERWHEQNTLAHQPAPRRPLLQGDPGFANYNYPQKSFPQSSYTPSPVHHPARKILSGTPGFSNFNHPQRCNDQESPREINRAHYPEFHSPDRNHFHYYNPPTYHSPDDYAYGRDATASSSAFHSISPNGRYNSYPPWNSPTLVNNSNYHQQSPVVKPLRRSLVPQIHEAPYYGNC